MENFEQNEQEENLSLQPSSTPRPSRKRKYLLIGIIAAILVVIVGVGILLLLAQKEALSEVSETSNSEQVLFATLQKMKDMRTFHLMMTLEARPTDQERAVTRSFSLNNNFDLTDQDNIRTIGTFSSEFSEKETVYYRLKGENRTIGDSIYTKITSNYSDLPDPSDSEIIGKWIQSESNAEENPLISSEEIENYRKKVLAILFDPSSYSLKDAQDTKDAYHYQVILKSTSLEEILSLVPNHINRLIPGPGIVNNSLVGDFPMEIWIKREGKLSWQGRIEKSLGKETFPTYNDQHIIITLEFSELGDQIIVEPPNDALKLEDIL